jgi:hypothetical protein
MSIRSPGSPLSPLVSPQVETSDDRVVVTYLDSNYLWKDYIVEPKDILHRQISVTDQEISCVIPEFWSHISRTSHIKHVGWTVNGETFQLPWPPSARDSLASPALSLQVQLHEGLDKALTYARWQESSRQIS